MSGGRKAAATNKLRWGADFYRVQGAKGGRAGRGAYYRGGFAGNRELAREAGRKGGTISRRRKPVVQIPAPAPLCETRGCLKYAYKHGFCPNHLEGLDSD